MGDHLLAWGGLISRPVTDPTRSCPTRRTISVMCADCLPESHRYGRWWAVGSALAKGTTVKQLIVILVLVVVSTACSSSTDGGTTATTDGGTTATTDGGASAVTENWGFHGYDI